MENQDLTKLIGNAIEKAKDMGGTAKYMLMIKAEEAKKQEMYFRLGRKYYDMCKDAPMEELKPYFDRLKLSDARINLYKEELQKEDNTEQNTEETCNEEA